MLLLHVTFILFFLLFVTAYLRVNNTRTVMANDDESDTVLFYLATCIHIVAIAVLFNSTHESLNSAALIFQGYSGAFLEFWQALAPVYGKILVTIALFLFVFTFLSRFFAKQIIAITKAWRLDDVRQEKQIVLVFITASIFLGLIIISHQYIETLAISYVPVLGGIN
jgi:hypothetical protein